MQEDPTVQTSPKHHASKLEIIPEGWSLKTLDEIGSFSKGKGISKKEILESKNTGYPCVRYAEIYTKYNNYTYTFNSQIDEQSAKESIELKNGDILFAGSGETLEDIGKAIAYLGNEKAYAGGDIIIFRQDGEDSKYLGFLMNNDYVRSQLHKLGQGHSVVHIYGKSLKKVKIKLPPLPEQQKIAQILSTWDKAIALQDQLIQEKQALKKGLMQQLLTGKKRFAGFEEEWEVKKLREIGEIYTGGTPSTSIEEYWNGKIRWFTPTEITKAGKYIDDSKRKITEIGLAQSSAQLFPKNTIIVCTRATIGKLSISINQGSTNQGFKNICPYSNYNLDFIYYKLLVEKRRFISKSSGSTFLELSTTDFRNFKILVPSLKEQQKIASVLSNFDTEIEHLVQHKKALVQQKQGLMQQLLSGEKRVKI